jgi:hypothetical protein
LLGHRVCIVHRQHQRRDKDEQRERQRVRREALSRHRPADRRDHQLEANHCKQLCVCRVDFSVTIPSAPSGSTALPTPNFPVTYDSRFIQISTNLFQGLAANCTASAGGCFITFNESIVSAHSFDWILGPLTSGNYGVTASWKSSLADSGIASSMTCVGPVNLTIQQNKIFNPSLKAGSSISS